MKSTGFILSEHIIGFAILLIGLSFFVINVQAIQQGVTQMETSVMSARVCKEYLYSGSYASDGHYRVCQQGHQVLVYRDKQRVLEIQKYET